MTPTDIEPGPSVLGVDVGGTTIKSRLYGPDGSVLESRRIATPSGDADATRTVTAIAELLDEARLIADVAAIGVAIPGVVDDEAGHSVASVNLGWRDLPIMRLVADRAGLPVGFGQDVRAGAIAEDTSGAGRDHEGSLAFVPVGTGLASAFVEHGVPLVSGGWAGEIGQVVLTQGPHAGLRVEDVASAGGLAKRLGAPHALAVAEQVRAGDPAATAAWNDAVSVLADTLSWIAAVAAPDLLVVGGGLAEAGDLLFDPLGTALDERLAFSRWPRLRRAVHGDAAAIVGAAILARRALA